MIVLAIARIGFRLKPKVWVLVSVVGMALILGLFGYVAHVVHQRAKAIADQFPLESMADRLAYEAKATAMPLTLSSPVEQRLSQFESRDSWTGRSAMLKTLHDQKRDEFGIAIGFGNSRLILPVREPIPLPSKPGPPGDAEAPVDLTTQDRPRPNEVNLLSIHETGSSDFVDTSRRGYIEDRNHVAGFVPHRFTRLPTLSLEKPAQEDWTMTRLELVSLLKHEVPVAYMSRHLPQMDELKDAPTRPLDEFERQALDRLKSDEDLVIDDAINRIRMVGSLRAGKDCLECHSVRRGELLGGFSYELVPKRPAPVKERRAKPRA